VGFRFGIDVDGLGRAPDGRLDHGKEGGSVAFPLDSPVPRPVRSNLVPEL